MACDFVDGVADSVVAMYSLVLRGACDPVIAENVRVFATGGARMSPIVDGKAEYSRVYNATPLENFPGELRGPKRDWEQH